MYTDIRHSPHPKELTIQVTRLRKEERNELLLASFINGELSKQVEVICTRSYRRYVYPVSN